ncbi:MAG: hypothetical protein ACHQK9_12200 [Reyranellales bacterium]
MKVFRVPDELFRPQAPDPVGSTSLLGGLPLPSEKSKYFWSGGPPYSAPSNEALSADANLDLVSGDDGVEGDDGVRPPQPPTPQPAPKPPWQQAVEAVQAVLAQQTAGIGIAAHTETTPARGTAPNVEPSPDSPEYQEAQARQATGQPGAVPAPAAAVLTVGAGQVAGTAGEGLAALAARAAPTLAAAAAAAPAVAAALPFMLIPTNTQRGTLGLGDGVRVRWFPDQRTATVERRVDNGLLGSGLGARWEPLPVDATYGAGPDGRLAIRIDSDQLKRAIGPGAAQQALRTAGIAPTPEPSGTAIPIIMEIRIGSSTNAGVKTTLREATRDEVLEVCPNFAEYEKMALKAAKRARAAGLPNGLGYGNRVHDEVGAELQKMSEVVKILEERGVHMLLPEIALLSGKDYSYFPKGSSVLDVLEIHKRKTVCVYDFKTGDARFPDETISRYAREAGLYAKTLPHGYTHIYVVPIRVP